ncbi:germ cell nuclear acidic protein [Bombina bombina]|uniref:germ cell nuclear acidic protein n=1 Tax=Bombina bombina TaxID=8345 RepID=UPI00235A9C4D|nr:germ cell nuclear acidic protein [Bombina bombina]
MATEYNSLLERVSARLGLGTETHRKQPRPISVGASPVAHSCTHKLLLSDSDSDTSPEDCQGKPHWPRDPNQKQLSCSGKLEDTNFKFVQKSKAAVFISDSSDDDFENFLTHLKTPKSSTNKAISQKHGSLKDFIIDSDDDFTSIFPSNGKYTRSKTGPKSSKKSEVSSSAEQGSVSSQGVVSPVFISDSDSDVMQNTWKDRIKSGNNVKLQSKSKQSIEKNSTGKILGKEKENVSLPLIKLNTPGSSGSSDEEFESLVERIKNRTKGQTPNSTAKSPHHPKPIVAESTKMPCIDLTNQRENGFIRKPKSQSELPAKPRTSSEKVFNLPDEPFEKPRSDSVRLPCRVPGCFLQELSNPKSSYVKNFKQTKHELTQRLYSLFNSTIFDQKLPGNMEIIWNKKMRKTAGYCVTGQKKLPDLQRYARIELSEKVCDSADRLRDTLIHEICHAATWLINGVRDGHGQYWKLYARKSTLSHPELPMVTRCHTYEINYKYTYECSRCKNTIGRHSKSLDTEKFVCALCKGKLVLLGSSKKDGTPSKNQLTPFAKFVKENYGSTKKEMTGMSHAEVMRKLSSDFSTKTKISN